MNEIKPNQFLALGAEATSAAAIDSGVKGVFGYPGTPSTEIFESAEHLINKLDDGRVAKWGANEKVAYEFSLGCSYTGQRTMVTMKHVGLNVAMDAFVNSALTGVQGGLVVAVSDDPSMHSSQNEQDSRVLADFAFIPCLEPSTPQEAYDYTCKAFELSEQMNTPVLLRTVTRLAHSRGIVNRGEMQAPINKGIPGPKDRFSWVLVPAIARERYKLLKSKMPKMIETCDAFNKITDRKSKKGIIACGMGRANLHQLAKAEPSVNEYNFFEISAYPVDEKKLRDFVYSCEEVFVFEEDYPYIEDKAKLMAQDKVKVHGRRDETLTFDGELTLNKLRKALGLELPKAKEAAKMDLPSRPPRLCDGCGHIDAFNALKQAMTNIGIEDPRIFGDIGCYTLGVQKPYEAIHTTVEMGASAGMALGAATVGLEPSVGVIGDSTFFHSGLPTMISMAQSDVNANLVIMDNRIVGMTGQQKTVAIDNIVEVVKGAGFSDEQIHVMNPIPKNHEENTKIVEEILKAKRPDIIIFRRECIQSLRKGINKN